jgi:hypothetical protein
MRKRDFDVHIGTWKIFTGDKSVTVGKEGIFCPFITDDLVTGLLRCFMEGNAEVEIIVL